MSTALPHLTAEERELLAECRADLASQECGPTVHPRHVVNLLAEVSRLRGALVTIRDGTNKIVPTGDVWVHSIIRAALNPPPGGKKE